MSKKPTIYSYTNYRDYLRDYYSYLKTHSKFFSFRYFSKVAGFTSPNILKLVMEGQRNLTKTSIKKFCKGLNLSKEDAKYFTYLVQFNQSKTSESKQKYSEKILSLQVIQEFSPLSLAQYKYYAHWYYIPLRELVGTTYFKEDPLWISQQLKPEITVAQAKEALEDLIQLKLIVRNSQGKLELAHKDICTPHSVGSSSVAHFHREMLKLAEESIDRFQSEDRELSSSTVVVSEESFFKIKNLIQNFRDELVALCSQESQPERVCHIGIQLFPLTGKNEDL